MRILINTQMLVLVIMALTTFFIWSGAVSLAVLYGGLVAVAVALLAQRSTQNAFDAAVQGNGHVMVVMFSGFTQRYAAVILGLVAGLKVLKLMAVPMLVSFMLTMMVQIVMSFIIRPEP